MKREKTLYKDTAKISRLKTGGMIAALVAAAAVFTILIQMEKSVLAQYEKGVIYTAAVEIPKGQVITEDNYLQYFQEKELDKNCIPKAALTSVEEIRGLCAVFNIDDGALLTKGMFEMLDTVVYGMPEPVVAGFKAEDIYQVVGGVLRAGDRIHIYTVSERGEAVLQWENIYVEGVFDQTGAIIANDDCTTAAQRINVYLDKADIDKFYTGLANGSLRVVKVL